jgi:Uma2 family endonuclease
MGPHPLDDWRTTPEERLELIDGHFRELPLFTGRHQRIRYKLCRLLDDEHDEHDEHRSAIPGVGFEISAERRIALIPDVVVTNRWPARGYPVPAEVDLVVEVWSPEDGTEDRDYRRRTYASVAIPYFWTVEVNGPVVEAFELRAGRYRLAATLRGGTTGTITAAPVPVTFDPSYLAR